MKTGKLFYCDKGRIMETKNEEIARNSWIRKAFDMDVREPLQSTLSLFILEYKGNTEPLAVRINGSSYLIQPDPERQGFFDWRTLELPAGIAVSGMNEVLLSSENLAFSSWMVAVDNGNDSGASSKSFDQGQTWISDKIGYDYSLRGEYVIRWYVEMDEEQPASNEPPMFVLQPLNHPELPRFREYGNLGVLLEGANTDFERAVRLCSWAAKQWLHSNGEIYPPFHFPTILDWKRNERGHGKNNVRGFCVHFANLFIQACWSCGLYARGVALSSFHPIDPGFAHFVSEVYCRELNRWVMFDPDFDVHLLDRNEPMSIGEIHKHSRKGTTNDLVIYKGLSFGINPLGFDHFLSCLHKGGFKKFAIWREQDYVSRPDHQPINHGAVVAKPYHEPDFVWYDESLEYAKQFPFVTRRLEDLYFDPISWLERGE